MGKEQNGRETAGKRKGTGRLETLAPPQAYAALETLSKGLDKKAKKKREKRKHSGTPLEGGRKKQETRLVIELTSLKRR